MADKTYKLTFNMSDGTTQTVTFAVPQGEKGEKGDTGVQGIQGEKGDTGPQGNVGATGPQGSAGVGITNITIAEV